MEQNVQVLYNKHKELEEKTKELKVLKNEYDVLSETIKEQMQHENIFKFKLQNSIVLNLKEKKSFCSLNKDYILETLKYFYKQPVINQKQPDQLAEITTETLIENRESKVQFILKFLKR